MSAKKERQKVIRCFLFFGPCEKEHKKVRTITKIVTKSPMSSRDLKTELRPQRVSREAPGEEEIDESSIALLCLPDGIQEKCGDNLEPSFHSFLITKQNGSRIYGSSLIFWESVEQQSNSGENRMYTNKAYCFLTTVPFVIAMKRLLIYIWENRCGSSVIQSICNVKMPSKGKCIKLVLPQRKLLRSVDKSIEASQNNCERDRFLEVFIYRGLSNFPLFDYPFRELFLNVLSLDQFLIAFVATLLEFQIIITSNDYHYLMMVSEALTSVLLPFHWQHVYVPILPAKLGLNYLDAPTPYIMGLNSSSVKDSIASGSWSSSVQCRIDCDNDKVEYFCDDADIHRCLLENVPPFVDELKAEVISILTSDIKLATQFSSLSRIKSSALKRVTEVTKKYQLITSKFSYLDDLKLNQSIRIAFLRSIKKFILTDYEKFIVNAYSTRDSVKFDTVSYMCDQPDLMKPFLSKFLETQMFASFIDDTARKIQRNKQRLFSSQGSLTNVSTNEDPDELAVFNDLLLETRFNGAQVINVYPINGGDSCSNLYNDNTVVKMISSPVRRRANRTQVSQNHVLLSPLSQNSKEKLISEDAVLSSPVRVPAAFAAQTNWKVVESLLKEVKMKTKRILLEKMGKEEIAPLGCGSVGDLEENTLIASLCDLIERIWSHATTNDSEHSKCFFWTHLTAFTAIETDIQNNSSIDSSVLTPALSQLSLDASPSHPSSSSSTPSSPSRQSNSNQYLKPTPTTLHQDFKSVQLMCDVKTDVGKSRAFIRLALERKLLSKHLRALLSNYNLLQSMYKRYAFLRCEEEREQFLTHLLTLNAVDLHCFTNTFNTSYIPYTLLIYGSNSLSGWISLSGTLCSVNEIYIPNPTTVFTFKHKNLGFLSTLAVRVTHGAKIFIEYCFVRNEITGHVFKFPCNHWFGRSIEDGATERLLIAYSMVNSTVGEVIKKSQQGRSSSIGRHWSRNVDAYKDEMLDVEELQEKLGEVVNQIVRLYYSKCVQEAKFDSKERASSSPPKRNNFNVNVKTSSTTLSSCHKQYSRTFAGFSGHHEPNLIHLLMGEKQLLWTLVEIFYFGFKNRGRSSFRKQVFLWDYLLRIQCELKLLNVATVKDTKAVDYKGKFIKTIDDISTSAMNWGKDAKFQLFLLLSIRDHVLTHFFRFLTKPSFSHSFYESNSFLRDKTLINFLVEILETFNDMNLDIEPSLTKCL